MKGTVKWFNAHKGYGFITDENGEDIFVHYTSIDGDGFKTLDNDQEVTFKTKDTDKGTVAIDVKKC